MENLENAEIAIQKSGRLTKGSLQWLNERMGADFPVTEDPFDKRRELTDAATGITVVGYSNGDTLKAVSCGQTDLAICGSDKYGELMAPYNRGVMPYNKFEQGKPAADNPFRLTDTPRKLGFAGCQLVLARPKGSSWPIARVATSYPKLTRMFAKFSGMGNVVVDSFAGGVEVIARRNQNRYDAIIDIVQSGDTLSKNGFEEEAVLQSCEALLVGRGADYTGIPAKPITPNAFEASELGTKLAIIADGDKKTSDKFVDDYDIKTPLLFAARIGGYGGVEYKARQPVGNFGNH